MSNELKLLGTRFEHWTNGDGKGSKARLFDVGDGHVVVGILEKDKDGQVLARTLQAYLNNGEVGMQPVTDGEKPAIRASGDKEYVTYEIKPAGIRRLEGLLGLSGLKTRMAEEEAFHSAAESITRAMEEQKAKENRAAHEEWALRSRGMGTTVIGSRGADR